MKLTASATCLVAATAMLLAGVPGAADADTCRRQCKRGETRDARGCCVPDANKKPKRDERKPAKRVRHGQIFVNSNVRGALIYLNGKHLKETTPATIKGLRPGRYIVMVEHAGKTWKRAVQVSAGERDMLFAEFASQDKKPPRATGKPADGEGKAGKGETAAERAARAARLNDEGKRLWQKEKNIAAAAAKFREAVDLAPQDKYWYNLCYAQHQLARYREALRACQVVVVTSKNASLRKKAQVVIDDIKKRRGDK